MVVLSNLGLQLLRRRHLFCSQLLQLDQREQVVTLHVDLRLDTLGRQLRQKLAPLLFFFFGCSS